MKRYLSILFVAILLIGNAVELEAQKNEFNPITTGVTSLSIAPDARGA